MTLVQLPAGPSSVRFTHGAPYGHHVARRPIIEVEVAATDAQGVLIGTPVTTTVLVDSGADVTMLDGGLASTLGINLADPRYPKDTVGGVGTGGPQVARVDMKLDLCGAWRDVPVNFTLSPIGHPQLLGREGAFDALIFNFLHGHNLLLAAAA